MQAEQYTKNNEDCKLYPYHCPSKKLTIAWGINLDDGISQEMANAMFQVAWKETVQECANFPFWEKLNDTRKGVLVDMCYNMGLPRLLGFENMIRALAHEDYEKAADEIVDSKYWRNPYTHGRAQNNSELMRSGTWDCLTS